MTGTHYEDSPLDRLGLLLEQLTGMMAVATSADLEELQAQHLRSFLFTLEDAAIRANGAFHEVVDESSAQRKAERERAAGSVQ